MRWSRQQEDAWERLQLGPRWQLKQPKSRANKLVQAPAELTWTSLREQVSGCQACSLAQSRKQTVFGSGTEQGDWALIGEAPGAEEDTQGEAFVGLAGQLLDQMLASMGWNRSRDLFIANVVKCRPPANRNPSAQECAACAGFLEAQLQLLRPKAVLILGRVAAQQLLGFESSIASLRGKPQRLSIGAGVASFEVPALVSYHPAYLLRHLEDKAKAWEDLNRFAQLLEEARIS